MKAMTALEQSCAEALAFALADVMWTSMPTLFGEPPESVVAITLPFACALVRAEAKAARNKKQARKYRKLQREVREMLRAEPDAPVPAPALTGTVAFDPMAWHTELRPGASGEALLAGDAR